MVACRELARVPQVEGPCVCRGREVGRGLAPLEKGKKFRAPGVKVPGSGVARVCPADGVSCIVFGSPAVGSRGEECTRVALSLENRSVWSEQGPPKYGEPISACLQHD